MFKITVLKRNCWHSFVFTRQYLADFYYLDEALKFNDSQSIWATEKKASNKWKKGWGEKKKAKDWTLVRDFVFHKAIPVNKHNGVQVHTFVALTSCSLRVGCPPKGSLWKLWEVWLDILLPQSGKHKRTNFCCVSVCRAALMQVETSVECFNVSLTNAFAVITAPRFTDVQSKLQMIKRWY